MNQFELKIKMPQAQPVVFNYESLKKDLTNALTDYQGRIYTEDMIAEAKSDKAKLNALKKALSDERVARKKEFEAPFKTFEDQIKDLCGIIDNVTSGISEQLDAYEQKRIEEKKTAIKELFSAIASEYDVDFITLDKIYNAKWENKTATDKAIATEITGRFEQAIRDLEVIAQMPNFSFEAKEVYKRTLDLNQAIAEGKRMSDIAEAKRQAALRKAQEEIEARKHIEELNNLPKEEAILEPTPEPVAEPTYEVAFKCRVTRSQAIALKDFCTKNGITLINIK